MNRQKCGSILNVSVAANTTYPKWNKCKKWSQSWAGNHLACVFTNISKSTLWSALQQKSHSHAQDSAMTNIFWQYPKSTRFSTNSHDYFFSSSRNYFPSFEKFHRYEPKGLKLSQMCNVCDSHPISAHVRTCTLMSTRHAELIIISSICRRIFPILCAVANKQLIYKIQTCDNRRN